MARFDLARVAARMLLASGAVLAGFGARELSTAQLLVGPVAATVLAGVLFYFFAYAPLARALQSPPHAVVPDDEQRTWVAIASLVLAMLAVEGLVFATLSEPITTSGTVRGKFVTRGRYQPTAFRLELDDRNYFNIPLGQGQTVQKGRRVSYTHRDAWLGVRIVTSYDLGRRP